MTTQCGYGRSGDRDSADIALIPFAMAMYEHWFGSPWIAAGVFSGLELLSKFTAGMLNSRGTGTHMLVPRWRRRWRWRPYPWAAALMPWLGLDRLRSASLHLTIVIADV